MDQRKLSTLTSPSFPDLHLFQTTPAPQRHPQTSLPRSLGSQAKPTPHPDQPNHTRTPFSNPYRSYKRIALLEYIAEHPKNTQF